METETLITLVVEINFRETLLYLIKKERKVVLQINLKNKVISVNCALESVLIFNYES